MVYIFFLFSYFHILFRFAFLQLRGSELRDKCVWRIFQCLKLINPLKKTAKARKEEDHFSENILLG
jgi:hypothetical protein